MKTENNIIIVSIILGLFVEIADSVVDYFLFYEKPFWDLLIFDVPGVELFMRLIIFASFIIFGIIVSRIMLKRKQAEEALRASEERLDAIFSSVHTGYNY